MDAEARLVGALKGRTLAMAESMTGGLVLERLTRVAGASAVIAGGVVAYTDAVKHDVLGVDLHRLAVHGAVDEEVAIEMAKGVRRLLKADLAVSVTGFAGPGAPEGALGRVWFGVATADGVTASLSRFEGDRASIREQAATEAIRLALAAIEGR